MVVGILQFLFLAWLLLVIDHIVRPLTKLPVIGFFIGIGLFLVELTYVILCIVYAIKGA